MSLEQAAEAVENDLRTLKSEVRMQREAIEALIVRVHVLEQQVLDLNETQVKLGVSVERLEDGPAPNSYGPTCTCCQACAK